MQPSWSPELPPLSTALWLGPLVAAVILASGLLCGWLRVRRDVRVGDTRKIFHFSIFTTATILAITSGVAGVNLLGGLVAIYIGWILWLGESHLLYEGLARPTDRPRRSLYILLPFAATAVGGILSVLLFGRFAVLGYAVTGCGDAIAEPIGIRFGKHRYRVPGLGIGVASERSVEGSASVFVASLVAALAVLSLPEFLAGDPWGRRLAIAAAVAAASTVVEAGSHHGLDNLTIQLAASGLGWWVCGE